MSDVRSELQRRLSGRVCLMGLGNVLYGDDGLGVRLAEEMQRHAASHDEQGWRTIVAGSSPDRFMGRVAAEGFDHLLLVDAVDFGGAPGSAALLDSREIAARFPMVSTHKVPLGLLARTAEAGGGTRVWLLGVQPASLGCGDTLSPAVARSVAALAAILRDVQAGVCAQ